MNDHDHDRDPVVADALRRLPVADHGPGFWADLERRFDLADRGEQDGDELPRSERVVVPMVSVPPEAPPQDLRIATGELPALAVLPAAHDAPRVRHTGRWLGVAAAVLVIASAVAITTISRNGGGDGAGQFADAPTTTLATTFGAQIGPAPTLPAPETASTTVPASVPPDRQGAVEVVQQWVDALGAGDVGTAASLLGPRSTRYAASYSDPQAVMSSAVPDIGSWASSPAVDFSYVGDVSIAQPDGSMGDATDSGEVAVVVVGGIWGDARTQQQRYDVFPVVDTSDGWRIEFQGYDPTVGGTVEFQTPPPAQGGGLDPISGDGLIETYFTQMGQVMYVVDGVPLYSRATAMVPPGSPVAEPYANVELRNRLSPGQHSLSIVFASPDAVYSDGPVTLTIAG